MKRNRLYLICGVLLMAMGTGVSAQTISQKYPVDQQALSEWQAMRFGMFIHWGPVSLKGTEIGWSRGREVPVEEYDALYKSFNPEKFDATAWAQTAKDAGMKYMVFTSKHHDGFCMWDTKYTDYNIMNSPFGRDVLKELSAACKEVGIKFGMYYTVLDWYHPDYNTDGSNGGPGFKLPEGQTPDMDRFQEYIHNQTRELVENYGPLVTMWFDGEWEDPWTVERGIKLFKHCRALDPHMLVNNRVGKDRHGMEGTTKQSSLNPGDYDTPEQTVGTFNNDRPWETCMTICQQWAWKPNDRMKSFKQCIQTLVSTVGGDGNLLFNVGPMPDGRIEPRQVERLKEMGQWLEANGESIYGTRGGPFLPGKWGCSTHRGDTIYVHVFKWKGNKLELPKLDNEIVSVQLMNGANVKCKQNKDGVVLKLAKDKQDSVDTIVVLKVK